MTADGPIDPSTIHTMSDDTVADEQVLELREEQLVINKELRELGDIVVRRTIEEVPGRIETDAFSEQVEIEHEPAGETVSERRAPWDEDGTLVVPIYEEQLVLVKRLVLKERIRIRRVGATEHRVFEDTLRRERLVIEDPRNTGLVREVYPADEPTDDTAETQHASPGVLESIARKVLE